jgi:hypothetical protein
MVKTWANVEKVFKFLKINYEQRDWFYLCEIKGRLFYYSPQTGKWRVKGKRVWHPSHGLLDFIGMAQKYSPPRNNFNQTSEDPKKNQRKNSKKKSSKTKQNNQRKSSSNQKRKTGKVDEIRSEFLERFGQLLEQQREHNYKIGWIWYCLIRDFVPTPQEICWLCVVFEYSEYWAFYKIKDFYLHVNREQVFATIEKNRNRWLNYFQNRWGSKNKNQAKKEQQREQQSNRSNQFTEYPFSHQHYLSLLKISYPFTKQELKSAYRKMALQTHPDSGGTTEAFREVHTAYQILLKFQA